jgi:glycosyltransferase involved in cell wall biosynthesis
VPPRDSLSILYVSQGRAREGNALGHARVRDALALEPPPDGVRLGYEEIRPFSRLERLAVRPYPAPWGRDYWRLRWHLLRGFLARRAVEARVRPEPPDAILFVTEQITFLMGSIQRRFPTALSLDATTYDWLLTLEGLPLDGVAPPGLRWLRSMNRQALERAAVCVCWTDFVAQGVRRLSPTARTVVLHPGLDLEAFQPAPRPPDRPEVRMLFVGGNWSRKGGPDLLAALEPHLGDSVRLDVVTDHPVPQQPGVFVHRAAPASEEIRRLFAEADVCCLPSHADLVPWVVVEALASGLAVVASDIGSIPELVGDAGLTVPPGDVRELRQALETVAADEALRRRMGEAGRRQAEQRYDARRNMPELFGLLEEIAS